MQNKHSLERKYEKIKNFFITREYFTVSDAQEALGDKRAAELPAGYVERYVL
ncbi:MAG: hypothetical protein HYU63_05060 [Armatimonadetes bacterium]|nr:hypothetical protein [Armatimonadota bacterium]